MNYFDETDHQMLPFKLFMCVEGCWHLAWGNLALRFSAPQFEYFIRSLNRVYNQSKSEPPLFDDINELRHAHDPIM